MRVVACISFCAAGMVRGQATSTAAMVQKVLGVALRGSVDMIFVASDKAVKSVDSSMIMALLIVAGSVNVGEVQAAFEGLSLEGPNESLHFYGSTITNNSTLM